MTISIILLVAAIMVNTLMVYLKKKHRVQSYDVRLHGYLITPLWALFAASLLFVMLEPTYPFRLSIWFSLLGFAGLIASIALFARVIRLLGFGSMVNKDIFQETKRVSDWSFRYLRHPMYVSYVLGITSYGLIFGAMDFFVIAAIALVGLVIEGEVESS